MKTLPDLTQEQKLRTTPKPSASMIRTWYDCLLRDNKIFVQVANNEQLPLMEEELKLPVRQMLTKKHSGYDQVGDYVVTVNNHTVRFVVERKELDLYSTLYFHRKRFYREIERFNEDDRFDSFIILVGQTKQEFLDCVPVRKACKFCTEYIPNKKPDGKKDIIGICKKYKSITKELEKCHEFEEKETYEFRRDSLINSKKASINSLNVRPGVKVIWCDSRAGIIETFRDMIRQYCLQNWKEIIG